MLFEGNTVLRGQTPQVGAPACSAAPAEALAIK